MGEIGYQLARARDGQDSLDHLQRAALPMVVLLDWMMPGMNGAELLAAMRADPRLESVPVILMSAVADFVQPVGATVVILKPFKFADLVGAVDRILGSRGARVG